MGPTCAGFEGLWGGVGRAQPQHLHQQQQQRPQEAGLHSPQKRQRQAAPGQAILPVDDFGLGTGTHQVRVFIAVRSLFPPVDG